MRTPLVLAGALLAVGCTETAAWASSAGRSVAVLVESSSGSPALPSRIEAELSRQGLGAMAGDEVRAAMEFFGVAPPLSRRAAYDLRGKLRVDRLILVSEEELLEGPGLRGRFVDESRTIRRIIAREPNEPFDDAVLRLLRIAPVMVERGSVPAAPKPPTGPSLPRPIPRSTPSPYGTAGTFEAGAVFGYLDASGRERFEFSNEDAVNTPTTATNLVVTPLVGYFPVGSVEVLGLASTWSAAGTFGRDEDSDSGSYLAVGVAVLPRVGKRIRFGPQITGGMVQRRQHSRFEYVVDAIGVLRMQERGTRGTAGLVMKVPLGRSALLAVDAHWYSEVASFRYTYEYYDDDQSPGTARHSGFSLSVGISVFRPGGGR